MDAKEKLDRLSEMQSHADVISKHFDDLRDKIIPQEIKAQLEDLETERKTALDALNNGITELTDEIKADVLAEGATVKGVYLMAVWNKGRVSWDTKALDGVAAIYPEVAKLKKEGDPSVSIRAVK